MSEKQGERNIESAICYIPIVSILIAPVVFIVEQDDKFVRFHAVQGFLLSLLYYVLIYVLGSLPLLGNFVAIGIFIIFLVVWVFGMYNSYIGHTFKFPIIGDFAEKKVK